MLLILAVCFNRYIHIIHFSIFIKPASMCVCLSVHTFKHEYLRNHQADRNKNHWGGGKDALGFGPDPIRTGFYGNR